MIKTVSGIKLTGGGDCPELAAAGILKGEESSYQSYSYFVFLLRKSKFIIFKISEAKSNVF